MAKSTRSNQPDDRSTRTASTSIVDPMRWIPAWPTSGTVDAPSAPSRRDLYIVFALGVFVVADIPEDVATWQPASMIAGFTAAIATYWRRPFPLGALAVGFGAQFAADVAAAVTGNQIQSTTGHVFGLGLLAYAVCRWGTWRAMAVGLALALALPLVGEAVVAGTNWDQQVSDQLLIGLMAAIGIAVRYRSVSERARANQIRSEERERIARDLHDVVAHHVSAIALQAEGATAAADTNPAAAIEALEHIHEMASTTLSEMRTMVTTLRDESEPGALSPNTSLHELHDLLALSEELPVELRITGDVETLPSSTTTALLRITQEGVTNARRHSRNAKSISAVIERCDATVEVTITDDGDRVGLATTNGYGIIGMTERCSLLGGELSAAPSPDGGWRVHATIPTSSPVR